MGVDDAEGILFIEPWRRTADLGLAISGERSAKGLKGSVAGENADAGLEPRALRGVCIFWCWCWP